MLAIVIPTILATLGVAFWFRASNTRARYLPDFEYSGRLEMIVWSIPAMTVMLLGSLCWVGSHDLDPRKPLASAVKPVTVQVVSLDWKWLFIYPEQGVAAVNTLTIPAGTPISFELTSSGVMNSFMVPQLGSQIYTMGAMTTRLQLQADGPGTYRGPFVQFQRRRLFRYALSRPCGAAGSVHCLGCENQGRGTDARCAELCGAGKAEPCGTAVYLRLRQLRPVRNDRERWHAGRTLPHRRAQLTHGGLCFALTWEAELGRDPVRPADTLVRVRADDPGRRPRPRLDHIERALAVSLARVADLGRSQAHRRDVLRARAW